MSLPAVRGDAVAGRRRPRRAAAGDPQPCRLLQRRRSLQPAGLLRRRRSEPLHGARPAGGRGAARRAALERPVRPLPARRRATGPGLVPHRAPGPQPAHGGRRAAGGGGAPARAGRRDGGGRVRRLAPDAEPRSPVRRGREGAARDRRRRAPHAARARARAQRLRVPPRAHVSRAHRVLAAWLPAAPQGPDGGRPGLRRGRRAAGGGGEGGLLEPQSPDQRVPQGLRRAAVRDSRPHVAVRFVRTFAGHAQKAHRPPIDSLPIALLRRRAAQSGGPMRVRLTAGVVAVAALLALPVSASGHAERATAFGALMDLADFNGVTGSGYVATKNLHGMGFTERAVAGTGLAQINSDLAFWGQTAYQGTWSGFRIVDISEPDNPQTVN